MAGALDRARTAFDGGDWAQAYALFAAARPVGAADLERLAVAAYLTGQDRVAQHFVVRRDTLATAGAVLLGHDVDVPVF